MLSAISSESTRWSIIHRASQGEHAERAEFVLFYGRVIRSYFDARWRRTPLAAEIEDATQQVLLDGLRAGGALERLDPERDRGFRSYLLDAIRSVALRFEERRARPRERRARRAVDLESLASGAESCDSAFDREWARNMLRRASELQRARSQEQGPEARRRYELIGLRFGEGLAIHEVAELWRVDPERLHREYAAAREEFKRALPEVVRLVDGRSGAAGEAECARLLRIFS